MIRDYSFDPLTPEEVQRMISDALEAEYPKIKQRLIEELRVQHSAETLRLSHGLYYGQLLDTTDTGAR
jgi:hypothetical protein